MVRDCLLLRSSLDSAFKLIKELSQVLFNVHLLDYINRVAVPVLKSMTVALRVNIHLLRE